MKVTDPKRASEDSNSMRISKVSKGANQATFSLSRVFSWEASDDTKCRLATVLEYFFEFKQIIRIIRRGKLWRQ